MTEPLSSEVLSRQPKLGGPFIRDPSSDKNPTNILITGGRAPVALDLARMFNRAGHTVFVAESFSAHLCKNSTAVAKCFDLPPPRDSIEDFAQRLTEIITANNIQMVVPTCEEVFHLAMIREQLPASCLLFTDSIDQLRQLHDKYAFVQRVRELGLEIPKTEMLTSREELASVIGRGDDIVLKPAYSRFGNDVILLPRKMSDVEGVEIGDERVWIAQEYLGTEQRCTYSVVHRGRLLAHATYKTTHKAGQGSSIFFKSSPLPEIDQWVEDFVSKIEFTGQISFDFITSPDGRTLPIECNPRSTSGVHLFGEGEALVSAILGSKGVAVRPDPNHKAMLGTLMLLYGFPKACLKWSIGRWFRDFWGGRDVIYSKGDLWPFVGQLSTMFAFAKVAARNRISITEATTLDIEWNG